MVFDLAKMESCEPSNLLDGIIDSAMACEPLQQVVHLLFEDRQQQIFFVLEVQVDGPVGDACLFGDVADPRLVKTFLANTSTAASVMRTRLSAVWWRGSDTSAPLALRVQRL